MLKKRITEFFITFCISITLQSLVDADLIQIWQLDQDDLANFMHLWLTLLSAYYLFNTSLQWLFRKWGIRYKKQWIKALAISSVLTIAYIIITDIAFYKIYYSVDSLSDETTFFDFDIPITLAVMILGSLYFYQKYHLNTISLPNKKDDTPKATEQLKAKSLNEHVFIQVDSVAILFIEHGIVWLTTLEGAKYQTDYTLNMLSDLLDPDNFFRLNRQIIAGRPAIKSFEKLPYQKLAVNLINVVNTNQEIVISKYNAPAFKKWLTNSA